VRISRLIVSVFGFAFCFVALSTTPLRAEKQPLRVGAAKVDITPKDLTNLNAMGGSFTDVHDPIYARALVLDNGVNTAAIVTLDLIEIGDTTQVRQRIQHELGIPVDHILITASHDHNAPRAGSVTPGAMAHAGGPESAAFTNTLFNRILDALKQAKTALQPAKFGLGTGTADVNVNRDEYTPQGWKIGFAPDRPSEKTVWVIKFESMSGEPIAVLFNYAVHSTVALGTRRLSGDLAGAAERYIEQRHSAKFVALYTMGPAGDQSPRASGGGPNPEGKDQKDDRAVAFDIMNALGLELGAEVVRVAGHIGDMTSQVSLIAAERIISCPTKHGVNMMADMKQEQVASVPIHLGLIMLNQVALTGVSGEVVTNIYRRLKRQSPLTNTIMLTIANDRIGYIADDAAYDTPLFEVNGSPAARGCAENGIVNGLVEMIGQSF